MCGGISEKSISWSFLAAMAAMSRFCSFVSFCIGPLFARFRGACGDNSNHFFIVPLTPAMDNEKQRVLSNGPNCYPSLFFSNAVIPQRESMRVVKNKHGGFKPN